MKRIWDEIGVFQVSEQRLADQARAIRTNEWLTNIEIEEIKRKITEGGIRASSSEEMIGQEIPENNSDQTSTREETGTETRGHCNDTEQDILDRARADGKGEKSREKVQADHR